jgi:hypothetical protein
VRFELTRADIMAGAIMQARVGAAFTKQSLHGKPFFDAHRAERHISCRRFDRPDIFIGSQAHAIATPFDASEPNCATKWQESDSGRCDGEHQRRAHEELPAVAAKAPPAVKDARFRHCHAGCRIAPPPRLSGSDVRRVAIHASSAKDIAVRRTPEFDFLTDCCRWNFARKERPAVCFPAHLDRSLFVRLARFHRVQGLAWRALTAQNHSIPSDVGEALASDSVSITASNLRAAHECSELLHSFASSAIPLLFLKGLTLGALAYGTTAAKAAVDIDILVPEPSLASSARLLESLGYQLLEPLHGDFKRLSRWHRLRKESLWTKQGTPIRVDLHTRLSDTPRLIPSIGNASPQQTVDVGNGICLPTLADDELFAYLAVHGAWSAWFRLKWIVDFAALLAPLPAAEIDRRYRRSTELGAGRCGPQALLLADVLFDSLSSNDALRSELRSEPAAQRLCRAALKQLAGRDDPVEPTSTALGTAAIHASELLLIPGLRFKFAELVRQGFVAFANRA